VSVVALLTCLAVAGTGCSSQRSPALSAADLDAIKVADREYATAWLENEPEQVMATLTADAVLMPSGLPVIEGKPEIRAFWWPADSPPTTVMRFTLVQDEAGGQGDLGFVRGSFTLGFEYDGSMSLNHGYYLSVLRRLPDGTWRISHRMWNDQPPPNN
jgi:ketosteroid isomerase-like protein